MMETILCVLVAVLALIAAFLLGFMTLFITLKKRYPVVYYVLMRFVEDEKKERRTMEVEK